MTSCDILIKGASLRGRTELIDIAITNGVITVIRPARAYDAAEFIDASGRLITDSFANPHLQLCKVWTLAMVQDVNQHPIAPPLKTRLIR